MDAIALHWRIGMNLPLPYPWPWMGERVRSLGLPGSSVYSLLFVLVPVAEAGVIFAALRSKRVFSPEALAGAVMGLMWFQYATTRPDVIHLSLAIQPALFMFFALSGKGPVRKGFLLLLLVFSLWAALPFPMASWKALFHNPIATRLNLRGQQTPVDIRASGGIESLRKEISSLPPGESVAFLPYLPGLYPALDLRPPLWDTYPIYPQGEAGQDRMIRELQEHHVTRVLLGFDSIPSTHPAGFSEIAPKVFEYLRTNYRMGPTLGSGPSLLWLVSRGASVQTEAEPRRLGSPGQ
jgi:hypothetical protein